MPEACDTVVAEIRAGDHYRTRPRGQADGF